MLTAQFKIIDEAIGYLGQTTCLHLSKVIVRAIETDTTLQEAMNSLFNDGTLSEYHLREEYSYPLFDDTDFFGIVAASFCEFTLKQKTLFLVSCAGRIDELVRTY